MTQPKQMMTMNHTKIYVALGIYSGLIYAEGDYISVRRLLNNRGKVSIQAPTRSHSKQVEFIEPLRIVSERRRC